MQEEGEGGFLSLSAAGRVFCGAGLASFPGNRGSRSPASPRNALPPQALGIQRGRAVGAPRVPRPRSSRARQEGFYLSSAAASGREGKARPAGLLSPPWKVFKRLSRVARRGRGRLCLGAQRTGLRRRRRLGALPALRRLGWAAAGPCPSCTGRTGGSPRARCCGELEGRGDRQLSVAGDVSPARSPRCRRLVLRLFPCVFFCRLPRPPPPRRPPQPVPRWSPRGRCPARAARTERPHQMTTSWRGPRGASGAVAAAPPARPRHRLRLRPAPRRHLWCGQGLPGPGGHPGAGRAPPAAPPPS